MAELLYSQQANSKGDGSEEGSEDAPKKMKNQAKMMTT
ncbi:MAG: hypothetical protein Ct9H300mP21_07770 [Pseudomonadota bacterium]|nr:MAG: hypothetical protein Ct9H300mP21_07770 [Pseudomonadota bacterium]